MKHGKVVNELDRAETFIGWIIFAGIMLTLMTGMTGCSTSAGWRFEISSVPITAVNDQASLTEHPEANDGK